MTSGTPRAAPSPYRGTVASYVCSPSDDLMNASFFVAGFLTLLGAVLLKPWWPQGRPATVSWYLWLVAGVGKILVAVVPENTNLDLHVMGAISIPLGSIAILFFSIAVRRTNPTLSWTGFVLSLLGLVGTVLSAAGQYGGSFLYLGLGPGGTERLAG